MLRSVPVMVCGFAWFLHGMASAQENSEPVPPVLETFVEAEYPPEAAAAGRGAVVEMLLTLDAEGRVTAAEVVTPVGEGFDEAALAAARRFVWKPATVGGKPVPARLRYRYVFELRPPPPTEPPAPPAPDGTPDEVAPTPDNAGEASAPPISDAGFEARATVAPPPREVTRRTIGKEELTRIPGTRGDALRAVELLPGVARPPFGAGLLLVRGSSPQDTGVFLDGSPVPLLYHFGGLTSFMNSRLLDRIDFYPGNFSVRYGRQLGGVLEVRGRPPAFDDLHGVADVNLIDASFLAEGPITEDWSIALAARRSYIDFFFKEVVPDDLFDVVSAPVYWDYQLITTWRPTDTDQITLSLYGSEDELELIFSRPLDGDPAVRGNVGQSTGFHRGQIVWNHAISKDVDQEVMMSFGPTAIDFSLGNALRFDATFWQYYGRAEWTGRASKQASFTGGLDMFWAPYEITYKGPPVTQGEGNPNQSTPFAAQPTENISATGRAYRPSAYLEANLVPLEPLRIIPGVRFDWYREIDAWAVNPRMASVLTLNEETRLKGGVGLFSQPPEFAESSPELGNPALPAKHALHTSLGVERDLVPGISVGVEGYWKHLWNLTVGTPEGLDPRFEGAGIGRIYGLEFLARASSPRLPFFGYLAYTLSRSERRDRPGTPWRPFDFDQTHILTLASVVQLGAGWEAGAAFRLVTGNPNTPIVGSDLLDDRGVYVPRYGAVNSVRSSTFHRLDLRVEKKWRFRTFSLATYLDVQNVYNRQNQEGLLYNYDFSQSEVLPGLPILPSLGVRGEL